MEGAIWRWRLTPRPAQALDELSGQVKACLVSGDPGGALALLWQAHDADPADIGVKVQLGAILRDHPGLAPAARHDDVMRLVTDPHIDPRHFVSAAWHLVKSRLAGTADAMAAQLESDAFAQALLRQSFVCDLETELLLTGVRRWMLLSGRADDFPLTVAALAAQALHNGGAWPFDAEEQAQLVMRAGNAILATYLPPREVGEAGTFGDPVTDAVARQYEGWPYPSWSRLSRRPYRFTDAPASAPRAAQDILIAGCGSGSEAILWAWSYPARTILAIDISGHSLRLAEQSAAALGITNIVFRRMDLHRVAETGRCFDFIVTSGVLHHLPDPEAGWRALANVLRPGGMMRIMVYSKLARLRVKAMRSIAVDLLDRPVDDDLLRAMRARLIAKCPHEMLKSLDFFTLGGVHDLLLHRHEDAFDVPRIGRAVAQTGLEFMGFEFHSPADAARYRRAHPDDPQQRDLAAWQAFEQRNPALFSKMYKFWCRKPI